MIEIKLTEEPVRSALAILLQDKTTKQNIIWATDAYMDSGHRDVDQITIEALLGLDPILLQPRISKTLEEQQERTRKKAEVMTPVWICNKLNNYADEQWLGRPDVFNHENDDHTWMVAYILGFTDEIRIEKHNIRLCDSLAYAKGGNLPNKLAEIFDDSLA